MKKILLVILVLLLAISVHADIKDTNVNVKLMDIVTSIRSSSASLEANLKESKRRIVSLRDGFGNSITGKDKTDIPVLITQIDTTLADLNTVISWIDTNYPSMRE